MAEPNFVEQHASHSKASQQKSLLLDPSAFLQQETIPFVESTYKSVTEESRESVTFFWLDPQEQSDLNLIAPLRAVNHNVKAFSDSSLCISEMKSCKQRVFFITSSNSHELIKSVHNLDSVEAIFVLASSVSYSIDVFPKLCGVFAQQEELFYELKTTLNTFEQIQLESFAFEQDTIFLWSQLWKEDLLNRKLVSKKNIFIERSQQYYRGNTTVCQIIDDFDKLYRSSDVINWCFRTPFPSRFVHHIIRSHDEEFLNICRFLFVDATQLFQQQQQQHGSKRKSRERFYRGMKLSSDLIDKFKDNVGQLVCANSFFPCTKSRTNAMALISSLAYRYDLNRVLFKVDCDITVPRIESNSKNSTSSTVFDICTAFRILYVNRDQLTVIKLKTAVESGAQVAMDYRQKQKDINIQVILDRLIRSIHCKPGTLPPIRQSSRSMSHQNQKQELNLTEEEKKARKYIEKGDIDLALATYQHIQPVTARILNAIGQICAEKKGNYSYALECHKKALEMQEEAGEDICETLTDLANAYYHSQELDLALGCHARALTLRESNKTTDDSVSASNLIGIGTIHWYRGEYTQAIDYVQRALALREKAKPLNKVSVAATRSLLGSIYHNLGNIPLAIELCKTAVSLYENTYPLDLSILADLYHNLATIQLGADLLDDAQRSFEQVAQIYRNTLPQGHPDRRSAEEDLQRVMQFTYHKNKSRESNA